MLKSEQINDLAAALSLTQSEIVDVVENQKADVRGKDGGTKFTYRYADLGAILEMARPIWTKYGLSIVQFPMSSDTGKIGLETVITHLSGQWMSSIVEFPIEGDGRMSMSQAAGSIITYARRYCLTAILAIAQVDDDGKAQEAEKPAEKKSADWKPAAIASIVEQTGKLLDAIKLPSVGIKAVHEVLTAHGITITPEEVGLRNGTLKERLAAIPTREKAGEIFRELQTRTPK